MQNRRLILGCALAVLGAASAASAAPEAIVGNWNTPAGLKVRVSPCRAKPAEICGTLIGLKQAADKSGPMLDTANPDPALRSRPLIGIQILSDLKATEPGAWAGGKVYELKAGKTYDAKVRSQPDGTLKVEGCVAVLCRAVTWTRAN